MIRVGMKFRVDNFNFKNKQLHFIITKIENDIVTVSCIDYNDDKLTINLDDAKDYIKDKYWIPLLLEERKKKLKKILKI